MLYGYARVSTVDQDTALQIAALHRAGISSELLVEEKASGAADRPELCRLLNRLSKGDGLVVWKVDRLARSLRGLLDVSDRLAAIGATLRSLTEPIDTGTPIGKAFFQLLGVFAELERCLINERCEAGRKEAMRRGVVFGRKPSFDHARARELRAQGLSLREVGALLGASPEAVRNAVRPRARGRRVRMDAAI